MADSFQFNVGVIAPLTGDLAEHGAAIRNGFELAIVQESAKYSHINFRYEDSRYEGKTAVSALQKLRASNLIDLYYLWGVAPTEAMLPISETYKLPVIAETTVKEATANAKYVVRAARTGEMIAKALVAELEKRKIKKVALITAEITFFNDIIKNMEVMLPQHGITVVLPLMEMEFR